MFSFFSFSLHSQIINLVEVQIFDLQSDDLRKYLK